MIQQQTTCGAGPVPRHDLAIRRGDSDTVILRFHTLSQTGATAILDLTGSSVTLHADWPGGGLTRHSGGGGLAIDGGTVTWLPTPEETRGVPEGRVATYRVVREVAGGERRTLIAGHLVGIDLIGEEGGHGDE